MTPDRLLSAIRAALDGLERTARYRLDDHSQFGAFEIDPDTVLRLVAAMREIVALYEFVTGHGPAVDHVRAMDMTTGAESALRDVVRALAHGLGIDPEETDG